MHYMSTGRKRRQLDTQAILLQELQSTRPIEAQPKSTSELFLLSLVPEMEKMDFAKKLRLQKEILDLFLRANAE